LKDEFFEPLGMFDTSLGATDDWFEGHDARTNRIPNFIVPDFATGGDDWNWNSTYWKRLGAPWGGLLSSIQDLTAFAQLMLRRGTAENGEQIISAASVGAATRNQFEYMRDIPEIERRCRPWGLGWRLDWPAHSANFGDLLGPRTYDIGEQPARSCGSIPMQAHLASC
jgi:CubicO group peptidase (beta-lactamase class C family)